MGRGLEAETVDFLVGGAWELAMELEVGNDAAVLVGDLSEFGFYLGMLGLDVGGELVFSGDGG